MNFTNLHLHSTWSILDAIIKPNDLASLLSDFNQQACAITDHASIGAWYDINDAFKEKNIKPIFGCEFYCRTTYTGEKTKDRRHLIVLAKNQQGLYNIRKLNKIANDNFYYKPILSYEELWKYPDGLVITSACALGDIGEALMKDDYQKAYKIAENFYEKFGEDYYLELQMHPKFEAQAKINEGIVTLNDELGIPTIVTSDSHFLNPEDANVRNIIEAIGYHKNIEDVYQSMESNSLGSPDRIKLWAEQSGFEHEDILKKSFKNTIDITNKCNAQLEEPQVRIPEFNRYEELDALFDEDWWC